MTHEQNVQVRRFREEDYDEIITLWTESELPYKPEGRDSRAKIAKEIKKETAIFLVAEKDGQIIATVLGTHDGRKGWINRLAVIPRYRHQGIARLLLKAAEEEIHKLGIEIIACLIEDYNDISMEFFSRAGYIKHTDIFYFSKRKHKGV
jgi:ribosomal protein S18 acetylase RimI-like enzyme